MANKKKNKRRTKIKGLSQPEKELTAQEAKEVKGGTSGLLSNTQVGQTTSGILGKASGF